MGVISSGDAVFLQAHTGSLVHVNDTSVLAQWSDYGEWQRFIVRKKYNDGAVMPGDAIFLQAHTGRYIDVEGDAVQARWSEQGEWQTLVVEMSSSRRLAQDSPQDVMV